MKQITIIGGGFAGLAAATRLCQAGHSITLLERRQQLGGRTFSFSDPVTGDTVDNGQHLFMKCYTATLDFLNLIGAQDDVVFQPHFQIDFRHADATTSRLSFPPYLPPPLNLLIGFLRFNAISWTDLLTLPKLKSALQTELPPDLTVDRWLNQCHQKPRMRKSFWDPLCIAALNEPPEAARAQHLQAVLKEAFFGQSDGALIGYARKGLSNLLAKKAQRYITDHGGRINFGVAVESITPTDNGVSIALRSGEELNTEICISAIPPPALSRLLSPATFPDLHALLSQFIPSPILSVNLWFDRAFMQEPFCGLLGTKMEWVFNKSTLYQNHDQASPGHLTLIASAARDLVSQSNSDLVDLAHREISQTMPHSQSAVLRHTKVIREHTGTHTLPLPFKPPKTQTPHPRLFLAGDWTDTGLPGTIESAVRSGQAAADIILSQ